MKLSSMKILFLMLFLTGFIISFSQTPEKRNYNTDFTNTAPVVDGLPDDECWNLVEWSGDFIQIQPEENKPPSQKTDFKILYDDNNLYVFIRAFDTEPDKISRIMSRRDYFEGDFVEIAIDSYYDKQTAFSFSAMASGAKGDEAVTQDGNNWDSSWNPIWFLKTSFNGEGWCAEMKIPFSQLRFGNKDEHTWGIQLSRHIYRLEERSRWQYIPKGSPGMVSLFGELKGIKNIKPARTIELLPYTVARHERYEKIEGNPFMDGRNTAFSAGLDGKAAITNDLTLDFSINPDFGQVEADPSEVNLTAFETQFSERRPFFIEGKNIFEFQPSQIIVINNIASDNLFYSRRIGRYPHYYPSTSENEYADIPEASTIIAASKLSGKTRKGLSIGIMESITADEKAVIDNGITRRKESVEPFTNYFVGRLMQDFNKGETVLGGMFTAVNRDINNPELDYLHRAAYTGGLDFQHRWKDRTWYVAAKTIFSNVKGKEEAIINTQRSSARYFQRPDAEYLSVDSSLTSLSGYGATLKLGKTSQKKLQFETSVSLRSPGLETNDIGYMRYTDVIHHGTWAGYYMRNPFTIFNNFYLNLNYWMYWNFSGKLLSTNANLNFNSQFKNRWWMNGSISAAGENVSVNLLRGGPSFISPGNKMYQFNLSSDQSKKISVYAGNYYSRGDAKSYTYREFWTGINLKPANSLSLSVNPGFSSQSSELQYVTTSAMDDDNRYLFARLDQKTLNLTLRVNYTINPELTIEYYGQPFISAGKYSNFKMITNPQAERFNERFHTFDAEEISFNEPDGYYIVDENSNGTEDYRIYNPDFNFRQYRSNLVIRWEYLPGSTVYLVWSQGITSTASDGLFSFRNDIRDLFDTKPQNIFLVKLSYWFAL